MTIEFPDSDAEDFGGGSGWAVIQAQDIQSASPIRIRTIRCTPDGFPIFSQRPNTNIVQSETTRTASLTAQNLDLGFFAGTRIHFHVFNDTTEGTLFIRFGNDASLSSWTVKVPPQAFYELPTTHGRLAERISGVWDIADGQARCEEWF